MSSDIFCNHLLLFPRYRLSAHSILVLFALSNNNRRDPERGAQMFCVTFGTLGLRTKHEKHLLGITGGLRRSSASSMVDAFLLSSRKDLVWIYRDHCPVCTSRIIKLEYLPLLL